MENRAAHPHCEFRGVPHGLLYRAVETQPRTKQLSTVATLPYRFLSCWCHAKSTFLRSQINPAVYCMFVHFLIRTLADPTYIVSSIIVCGPVQILLLFKFTLFCTWRCILILLFEAVIYLEGIVVVMFLVQSTHSYVTQRFWGGALRDDITKG